MKKLLLLFVALFTFSSLMVADSFKVYNNRASMGPEDVIDWSQFGAPFNFVNSPSLGSTFNGVPFLAGNINGGPMITMQQGVTWNGNFDYGESLMWTGNPAFGLGGGGPMAILFGAPVSSVGFNISADFYGAFTAVVEVLDLHGNVIGIGVWNGVSNSNSDGSALFIGFGDLNGANIGGILIETLQGGAPFDNDFAIDDVTLRYTPIPEPGTLMLIGTGLLGAAGTLRRKLMA